VCCGGWWRVLSASSNPSWVSCYELKLQVIRWLCGMCFFLGTFVQWTACGQDIVVLFYIRRDCSSVSLPGSLGSTVQMMSV
jgi:hypothetical protein